MLNWTTMHFHSEVNILGQWHHNSEHRIDLNNALFAKMANVKNTDPKLNITPISMPKGIPKDITRLTELHWNKHKKLTATHSASWLNAQEIMELHQWINDNAEKPEFRDYFNDPHPYGWLRLHFPIFTGMTFDGFAKSIGISPNSDNPWWCSDVWDVRYIFWFDN